MESLGLAKYAADYYRRTVPDACSSGLDDFTAGFVQCCWDEDLDDEEMVDRMVKAAMADPEVASEFAKECAKFELMEKQADGVGAAVAKGIGSWLAPAGRRLNALNPFSRGARPPVPHAPVPPAPHVPVPPVGQAAGQAAGHGAAQAAGHAGGDALSHLLSGPVASAAPQRTYAQMLSGNPLARGTGRALGYGAGAVSAVGGAALTGQMVAPGTYQRLTESDQQRTLREGGERAQTQALQQDQRRQFGETLAGELEHGFAGGEGLRPVNRGMNLTAHGNMRSDTPSGYALLDAGDQGGWLGRYRQNLPEQDRASFDRTAPYIAAIRQDPRLVQLLATNPTGAAGQTFTQALAHGAVESGNRTGLMGARRNPTQFVNQLREQFLPGAPALASLPLDREAIGKTMDAPVPQGITDAQLTTYLQQQGFNTDAFRQLPPQQQQQPGQTGQPIVSLNHLQARLNSADMRDPVVQTALDNIKKDPEFARQARAFEAQYPDVHEPTGNLLEDIWGQAGKAFGGWGRTMLLGGMGLGLFGMLSGLTGQTSGMGMWGPLLGGVGLAGLAATGGSQQGAGNLMGGLGSLFGMGQAPQGFSPLQAPPAPAQPAPAQPAPAAGAAPPAAAGNAPAPTQQETAQQRTQRTQQTRARVSEVVGSGRPADVERGSQMFADMLVSDRPDRAMELVDRETQFRMATPKVIAARSGGALTEQEATMLQRNLVPVLTALRKKLGMPSKFVPNRFMPGGTWSQE